MVKTITHLESVRDLHEELVVHMRDPSRLDDHGSAVYVGFITDEDGTSYLFVRNIGDFQTPRVQRVTIPKSKISIESGGIILPERLHGEFFEELRETGEPGERRDYGYCLDALIRAGLAEQHG